MSECYRSALVELMSNSSVNAQLVQKWGHVLPDTVVYQQHHLAEMQRMNELMSLVIGQVEGEREGDRQQQVSLGGSEEILINNADKSCVGANCDVGAGVVGAGSSVSMGANAGKPKAVAAAMIRTLGNLFSSSLHISTTLPLAEDIQDAINFNLSLPTAAIVGNDKRSSSTNNNNIKHHIINNNNVNSCDTSNDQLSIKTNPDEEKSCSSSLSSSSSSAASSVVIDIDDGNVVDDDGIKGFKMTGLLVEHSGQANRRLSYLANNTVLIFAIEVRS